MSKHAPVHIPRLVTDALYAPACPTEHVAMLLEVALTHHNAGRHADALTAYADARTAWEDALLAAAAAAAGLSALAAEVRAKPWLLTGEPDPASLVAAAEREHARMLRRQQRERDLLRAQQQHQQPQATGPSVSLSPPPAARSAHFADDDLHAQRGPGPEGGPGAATRPHDECVDSTGGHADADATAASEGDDDDEAEPTDPALLVDPVVHALKEGQLEELRRVYSLREQVIPPEHQVFLHLAVGGVYQSAQQDADALAEYGEAKRILVTQVPVFHTTLLATHVYAALGATHYHLSQFDFAGDYFFRCLESREQLCGPTHLDTAAALNNVGCVLYVLGRSADSLLLFNRAFAIVKEQLSLSHPRVGTVDTNIRMAKGTFLTDATFPAVPFAPYTPPMLPGALKAKKFRDPKPKKVAPAPKKGK